MGDPVNYSDPFGLSPCPPICSQADGAYIAEVPELPGCAADATARRRRHTIHAV
jgi:hypothetical protein